MFILYAIPVGLVLGGVAGGRLGGLATMPFRFGALAVAALAIQIGLFSPLADGLPVDVGRGLYVLSTAVVALVVLANIRITGLALVFLGAATNLAAIIANGGRMPADPGALASLGMGVEGNTNSAIVPNPALQPLTDLFAMPAGLPLANVFSIGDVLIGIGLVAAIAGAMRGASSTASASQPAHRSS